MLPDHGHHGKTKRRLGRTSSQQIPTVTDWEFEDITQGVTGS